MSFLTLFFIVVDVPPVLVHQRPCHATRSSRMLEMTYHVQTTEHDPIDEGHDRDTHDDDTLIIFIKKKKQKNK
jgi:hypothetical protein